MTTIPTRRGWRRLVALLVPLALIAAACGDDDDGDAASDADLDGTTIQVVGKWSGDEQASFLQVLADFEDSTGAEIQYTSAGDEIATVLGSRVSGGDPPDVAVLPQPGLLRDLAADGDLVPLDDVVGDLVDDNYSDLWRDLGSVDGTLYGVWIKGANKSTVWYSTQAFEDAGVDVPEDWDTFLEVAGTIADSGLEPISVGGADGWTLTDWFENVYLRTAGPEAYDRLTDHDLPWTDETVKVALRHLAEVFGDPQLLSGGTTTALQNDFPASVTRVFAEPRQAAIVYEGDFVSGVIRDESDAEVGEDADYFPFPAIDDSPDTVVGGGDVAVLMDDTEGGRALIEYLASAEAGEAWAELGGFISPNTGVDPDAYPDEVTRRIAADLGAAEVFRFDMSDLQPAAFGATEGSGSWGIFQSFLQNPADVDGAAQRLEEAAARTFG